MSPCWLCSPLGSWLRPALRSTWRCATPDAPVHSRITDMIRDLLPPEARLLLLSARPQFPLPELATTARDPALDWNRLVWLAQNERATAILWNALQGVQDAAVPAERAAQLSRLARVSEFRMQYL